MAYGRWFEEFTVGEVIPHWPGRTITEADCTWFALLVLGPLVFSIGDTIYSESTVLATRVSKQGDRGTVTVETRVTNQRRERVMTFLRTALVPKKHHATLGQHALP